MASTVCLIDRENYYKKKWQNIILNKNAMIILRFIEKLTDVFQNLQSISKVDPT